MSTVPTVASRSTDLARRLTTAGARVVVVGSTAQRLRGAADVVPRDLDVVVSAEALPSLGHALHQLGVPSGNLVRGGTVRTGWGLLDVFVDAPPRSIAVPVEGTAVAVCDD